MLLRVPHAALLRMREFILRILQHSLPARSTVAATARFGPAAFEARIRL